MKNLVKTPVIVTLLIIASAFAAKAQDSRIQMATLDHLAAKASQTVDVSIDERLMKAAAKLLSDGDTDEREVKKLVAGNAALTRLADSHLLGLIEPADIANTALYLASDESRMVTGQVLPVDSGVTIS